MRVVSRGIAGIVAIGIVFAGASLVHAAACGDANLTGSVTVTDGVLVLRAAAGISDNCPVDRCDMNLDRSVSVTDGVLALRVAAGIQTQVACSSTRADTGFGSIQKTMRFGSVVSPAGRARSAGTSSACPDGGSLEDDGFTLTFNECADGDFITDGTIDIEEGADLATLFFSITDFVRSTGEFIDTDGSLAYFFGVDDTQVDGVLDSTSSFVGSYTDEYSGVLLDADFFAFSGVVTTTITEGANEFENLTQLQTIIYSPTLAQIRVTYLNGEPDVFIVADGICEPCSSGCSNDSLTCVACDGDCTGSTNRCGIDFASVDCDDGSFGPRGLCDPCGSDDQCNTSDGLSCFDCADGCTGDVRRCGSSIAYVECDDGIY